MLVAFENFEQPDDVLVANGRHEGNFAADFVDLAWLQGRLVDDFNRHGFLC